jgi:predicted ATP-grasp superfamily ATP-dependent carboligase
MATLAASVTNPESKVDSRAAFGQPPVIVLNVFHTGLGIARQLWGTGVRVIGLSAHSQIYGNSSRLCEVRRAPNSQEHPEQLADLLVRIATDLQGAVVFPTRDADILFLDRFRAELEPFYTLAIPPKQVVSRVMDKAAVAQTAVNTGIPVPGTTVVKDESTLRSAAEAVGFPCVVKPISSVHWRQGNNWNRVGARKAFRVMNFLELQQVYDRIRGVHSEVLLQEWIPGGDDQLTIWGGYLSEQGHPLAYFTARKILQSPPEFGTGLAVETASIPALCDPSVRLCNALDYHGIAEIEYKLDSRDGQFKLIEINPRHWDWHELGRACQINITRVAYCALTGQKMQEVRPTFANTKWVAEDTFLMHALSRVYRRKTDALKPWRELGGHRIYGIFSWIDPMPFVRYFSAVILPKIAMSVIAKFSRRVRSSLRRGNLQTAPHSTKLFSDAKHCSYKNN